MKEIPKGFKARWISAWPVKFQTEAKHKTSICQVLSVEVKNFLWLYQILGITVLEEGPVALSSRRSVLAAHRAGRLDLCVSAHRAGSQHSGWALNWSRVAGKRALTWITLLRLGVRFYFTTACLHPFLKDTWSPAKCCYWGNIYYSYFVKR